MMMSKLSSSHSDGNSSLSSSTTSGEPYRSQLLNVTPNLTEDLLSQILDRLPVKTLLQYRRVSKPWCSLIDSPRFVKAQLKRSVECNTGTSLLIRGFVIYSLDFDSQYNATAKEIDEPLKSFLCCMGLVGTCNGLHCLNNQKPDIFLWNPATRKCKKLPAVPTDFRQPFDNDRSSQLCGFGYDVVHDDYKVLRIFQPGGFGHNLSASKVTMYGLKTNSWKRLENIPNHFRFVKPWGVFMCGALHWVTFKALESCFVILAFDLGIETYREVPFPNVENKNPNQLSLDIFAESLCLVYYNPSICIDVWVMNDYGVGNLWCKLFTVEHPKVIGSCIRPIAYSKSRRDVLLQSDYKVVWYNLEKKKVKTLKIANLPDMFDLDVYTQSLVSPEYGFGCDGKHLLNQQQEKKKQQQEQKKNNRDKFLAKGFKLVL